MLNFRVISRRFLHVSKANFCSSRSSSLAKLRKSTGYSISNCKKALEFFPDDVKKAEEWLHEEAKKKGWSKWAKIQTRSATQGLIGAYSNNSIAAMLEVNCETDFVAKNSEFQSFVEKVLISCINHANDYQQNEDILKINLDETQINSLKCESTTVGELVGAVTCKFNEKTVTKRAVCYKAKDGILLTSISHPGTMLANLPGGMLGKYGALVALKKKDNDGEQVEKDLSRDICQHIIGMNPSSIGHFTEEDLALLHEKEKSIKVDSDKEVFKSDIKAGNTEDETLSNSTKSKDAADDFSKSSENNSSDSGDDSSDSEDEASTSNIKEINEGRLLHQPFLLDPNITVGETVLKSSTEVLQFERFECGASEAQDSEEAVAQSASA